MFRYVKNSQLDALHKETWSRESSYIQDMIHFNQSSQFSSKFLIIQEMFQTKVKLFVAFIDVITIYYNFEKRQTYETMVSIRNDIAKEGVSLFKGREELDSVYELRRV